MIDPFKYTKLAGNIFTIAFYLHFYLDAKVPKDQEALRDPCLPQPSPLLAVSDSHKQSSRAVFVAHAITDGLHNHGLQHFKKLERTYLLFNTRRIEHQIRPESSELKGANVRGGSKRPPKTSQFRSATKVRRCSSSAFFFTSSARSLSLP